MTQLIERFYDDEQTYNQSIKSNISYILSKAVEENGHASFLVTGGKTAKPLYQSLSSEELFWDHIQVAMVDETNNEHCVLSNLIQNKAKEATIQSMSAFESFDVTILGMGSEGETVVSEPIDHDVSQTFSTLLQSKVIFLLLRGKDKLATYKRALGGNDVLEMPIRAILNQSRVPVIVNWAP